MTPVVVPIPGAVATYSAKSALFSAGVADRGTFFESTGSFTITLDTTSMAAGWSAWFRCVSGTQTFDPTSTTQINGATTYAVSNPGDVVLVEYTGSAFVISHTQRPSTVAITGGAIAGATINNAPIGGTTRAAGAFTALSLTQGIALGVTSTATAAGTTTLTATSTSIQIFTGSTTQIIQFPAANLFGAGIAVVFVISNQSSGTVTPTRAGTDTFQGGGTTDPVLAGAKQWYVSDGVSLWAKV